MEGTTPMIIALMLMGARVEPYLPAVLESLVGAVDHLVVNDNSQQPRSRNREVLESSRLFAEGRVHTLEAPFIHFSDARNRCLSLLRESVLRPGDEAWIVGVDCDEVHGGGLGIVTRRLLPALPPGVGIVDAYFVQFMHAFEWFISLDRRHNLFFRHNPSIQWENEVHERIVGLQGSRLCLPYVYYHYGYVTPARHILDKWTQYNQLGDPSYESSRLAEMGAEQLFESEVAKVMPFTAPHPPALAVLGRLDDIPDPAVEAFNRRAAGRLRLLAPRLGSHLRKANYGLRRVWRAVQALPAVPPRRWPDLLRLV